MKYEEFVEYIEKRPDNMSPLSRFVSMSNPPSEASSWLLQWLKQQREKGRQ